MRSTIIFSLLVAPLAIATPVAHTSKHLYKRMFDCDGVDSETLCSPSSKTITPHTAEGCQMVINAGLTAKLAPPNPGRPSAPCPPEGSQTSGDTSSSGNTSRSGDTSGSGGSSSSSAPPVATPTSSTPVASPSASTPATPEHGDTHEDSPAPVPTPSTSSSASTGSEGSTGGDDHPAPVPTPTPSTKPSTELSAHKAAPKVGGGVTGSGKQVVLKCTVDDS